MKERWVTIKGENGPEYVNMAHVRHIKPASGNRTLLVFGSDTDEAEAFLFVLNHPPEHFLPSKEIHVPAGLTSTADYNAENIEWLPCEHGWREITKCVICTPQGGDKKK